MSDTEIRSVRQTDRQRDRETERQSAYPGLPSQRTENKWSDAMGKERGNRNRMKEAIEK